MRVERPEEGEVLLPGGGLMRLALLENAIGVGLEDSPDRRQPLLRRSRTSVSECNAMKFRNQSIGPFHMLGLMFQQLLVGLIMEPLDRSNVHVSRVVERAANLSEHERRRKGEALGLHQIVHGGHIKGTSLGRELLDLYVGNALERVCGYRVLS